MFYCRIGAIVPSQWLKGAGNDRANPPLARRDIHDTWLQDRAEESFHLRQPVYEVPRADPNDRRSIYLGILRTCPNGRFKAYIPGDDGIPRTGVLAGHGNTDTHNSIGEAVHHLDQCDETYDILQPEVMEWWMFSDAPPWHPEDGPTPASRLAEAFHNAPSFM